MTVLEARGLFWWSNETVPDNQRGPASAVSGTLIIDDDGLVALDLDGFLSSKLGRLSALINSEPPDDACIRGLLKGTPQHILLVDLTRNGWSISTNGISNERYIASACLISRDDTDPSTAFEGLVVPLEGYEAWLRLNSLVITRRPASVSARYRKPLPVTYELPDETLTIEFSLEKELYPSSFHTEVSMKETASATFSFRSPLNLKDIRNKYHLFEDFLILFTTKECALGWPVVIAPGGSRYQLYFKRQQRRSVKVVPTVTECVVTFAEIRRRLGMNWRKWREMREECGPAIFLYLGTRRGMQMYLEHRFVNLIWAIEAFHRAKYKFAPGDGLTKKIRRIVEEVAKPADRRWLLKRLVHASEPALADRIFEVLKSLEAGFDDGRLREFSTTCARLRNDISHFGGKRHGSGSYDDFISDARTSINALSTLYQMVLLLEVGVAKKHLKRWMFEGPRSYPIKESFAEAKLISKP